MVMQDLFRNSLDIIGDFPIIPLGLSVLLSLQGLRRRSLSPSGALCAVVIAFIMMAVPLRVFGVSCIVFYVLGSRATKVGKTLKGRLEVGHASEGYRNGWQVGSYLLRGPYHEFFCMLGHIQRFFSPDCIGPVVRSIRPTIILVQSFTTKYRLNGDPLEH